MLLLALIDKGERADLSKDQQNALRRLLRDYADDYREGVKKKVAERKRKTSR